MSNETRLADLLAQLSMTLPPPSEPKGVYRPLGISGNLAFTAGHLPIDAAGKMTVGRLGADLDVAAGYAAARLVGLNLLSTLKRGLGSLDRVVRVVKVVGLVQCTPEFTQQPAVINGCSEVLAAVFGPEAGVGARSAYGVIAIPFGAPVEVEVIVEIGD